MINRVVRTIKVYLPDYRAIVTVKHTHELFELNIMAKTRREDISCERWPDTLKCYWQL